MSDESQLQVQPKNGDSSLSLSKTRSNLIARGRRDAEVLVPKEPADPLSKARQLAEEGNMDAQFELGLAYYEGHGVPRDYAEAVGWFRKAADQFHLYANLGLGEIYERGECVPADRAEALRYYFRAADIALACLKSGEAWKWDPDELCFAVGQGAEHGHAKAQVERGCIIANGALSWVPQDYAEAVKWWRKAAEQGNAEAQNALGKAYYFGEGVAQDYAEAARWYRKAAEQGVCTRCGKQNELIDGWCCVSCYVFADELIGSSLFWDSVDWSSGSYLSFVSARPNPARNPRALVRAFSDPKDALEAMKWLLELSEATDCPVVFDAIFAGWGGDWREVECDHVRVLAYVMVDRWALKSSGDTQKARVDFRDEIAKKMTPQQREQAQRLARQWLPDGLE